MTVLFKSPEHLLFQMGYEKHWVQPENSAFQQQRLPEHSERDKQLLLDLSKEGQFNFSAVVIHPLTLDRSSFNRSVKILNGFFKARDIQSANQCEQEFAALRDRCKKNHLTEQDEYMIDLYLVAIAVFFKGQVRPQPYVGFSNDCEYAKTFKELIKAQHAHAEIRSKVVELEIQIRKLTQSCEDLLKSSTQEPSDAPDLMASSAALASVSV